MIRRRTLPAMLAVCLAVLTTTVARAADDVLNLIPGKALGFVVVNRLADVDAKIQATAKQMQLPVPSLLAHFREKAEIQEGLDEKGTGAIAVMPPEKTDSEPVALLFFPVTDFAKFIEPMGPDDPSARIVEVRLFGEALGAKVGGYAVFAERKHRQTLENALDLEKSVADDVAFLRPWLSQNDVAGVMTSHGVKLLCTKGREGLREIRRGMEAFDAGPPDAAVAIWELYDRFFAATQEEVEAVALGARLDEQGVLRVTSRTRFAAGGQVAQCIGQLKPREADLLAGLPGGPFVLAFGATLPEGAAEGLIQFSADMMKAMRGLYGLSDEQVDQLMEQSRQSVESMRSMSLVVGVGKPGDPLYSDIVFVISVDDARAYMETYDDQIKAVGPLMKAAKSPISWNIQTEHVEIGGLPALKVEMELHAPAGAQDMPDFTPMMEMMFGPGGKMTFYMAAADEHTIVGAYTTEESLVRGIEAVKQREKSLAADKSVAQTAPLLPSGAPLVGYWSPAGTIDFINRAISLFSPGPQFGFQLPKFPDTPPIGCAVTTSPNELQTHMVVPTEVLKGIGAYVIEVRQGVVR